MPEAAKLQQHEIYVLIGRLISLWANTESMFLFIFWHILRCSDMNAALMFASYQSNYAKMSLLRSLIETNFKGDQRSRALKLVDRFKAPTGVRNELAHAQYRFDKEFYIVATTSVNTADLGKRPFLNTKPFDKARMNDIRQAIRSLEKLHADLVAFVLEIEADQQG